LVGHSRTIPRPGYCSPTPPTCAPAVGARDAPRKPSCSQPFPRSNRPLMRTTATVSRRRRSTVTAISCRWLRTSLRPAGLNAGHARGIVRLLALLADVRQALRRERHLPLRGPPYRDDGRQRGLYLRRGRHLRW